MTVFNTGLMSVTFRQQSIAGVVGLAQSAGLEKISWSGDVHVQPGNSSQADRARELSAAHGLAIEGYGSYWRSDDSPFTEILSTALRLGAPRIRIWAGSTGSAQTGKAEFDQTARHIAAAADLAAAEGVALHLEFHRNTLTDTSASTLELLAAVASAREIPGTPVRSYWQPRPGIGDAPALAELAALRDHVGALHVFSWDAASTRLPLETHAGPWLQRLRSVVLAGVPELDLMLEFVAGENPAQLLPDARILHGWIADAAAAAVPTTTNESEESLNAH